MFEFTKINSWSNLFEKLIESNNKESFIRNLKITHSHYNNKYIMLFLENKGFGILTEEVIKLVLLEEMLRDYKEDSDFFVGILKEERYEKMFQETLEEKSDLMEKTCTKDEDLQRYHKAIDWNFRH